MKKYIFATLLIASLSAVTFGQENFSEYNARFGGVVKKTDKAILEIVHKKENDQAKIYVLDPNNKNIADQKLSLSAIAFVKGKQYPVELTLKDDHYSANLANSYLRKEKNYSLQIMITFPGKTESASFELNNK